MNADFGYYIIVAIWILTIKLGVFNIVREMYWDYKATPYGDRSSVALFDIGQAIFKRISTRALRYIHILTWTGAFYFVTAILLKNTDLGV